MAKNNPAKNRQRPLAERLSAMAQTHQGDDKGLRLAVLDELRAHMAADRAAAQQGLEEKRLKGAKCAETLSAQMDAMLATLADFVSTHVLYIANPTDAEKVTMVAVGGYGRGRLAPHSDIDLLFLLPYKRNATSESFVEYILYMLWDLGLKVGHATRTVSHGRRDPRENEILLSTAQPDRCAAASSSSNRSASRSNGGSWTSTSAAGACVGFE